MPFCTTLRLLASAGVDQPLDVKTMHRPIFNRPTVVVARLAGKFGTDAW